MYKTEKEWLDWREKWGNFFRALSRNSNQISFLFRFVDLNKPVKILDCGCAFGDLLTIIKTGNSKITAKGVEIEKFAAKNAIKTLGKNNITCQDCTHKMPFKNSYFDLVFSFDVIEHLENVEDVRKMFNEIKRLLKKNGIFVVATPNTNIIMKIIYIITRNSYILDRTRHKTIFTHRTLKKELEDFFVCKNYKGYDLNIFTKFISFFGLYKHLCFVCKKS